MALAAAGGSLGRRWLRVGWLALGVVLLGLLVASFALRQFLAMVGRAAHPVVEIHIAGRQVAMWKPSGTALRDGYPVILFSHGFTGCGTQSVFLTEGLAHAGYFVLAPDHRDAACGPGHEGKLFEKLTTLRSEEPFHSPDVWTEATYRDRGVDLEAILDTILKERSFQGVPIDSSRVGLAGHSLGGYTVLAVAGAWPSWKDHRIKAVLALSPYCTPFIGKGDLDHLDVPVMYQGGTRDIGITPYVRRPGGAYDLTSSPKYFVEFAGAGHFAWTNLNKSYQPIINDYAVAFFDRYLKGARESGPLTRLVERPWPAEVSNLKHASNEQVAGEPQRVLP
ncbi:MAG: alpha/beta hydrolase family protein [Terriglobia bacterium]